MQTLESLPAFLGWVFGGDFPRIPLQLHQVLARSVLVYLMGIAILRLGKSRVVSRTSTLDVLVAFIIGSLLGRGITGNSSLSESFVATAGIVASHWLLTWSLIDSDWLGGVLKGHPALLIDDGKLKRDAMRHAHISEHDIQEYVRLAGADDYTKVKRAYKERNGEISVIMQ